MADTGSWRTHQVNPLILQPGPRPGQGPVPGPGPGSGSAPNCVWISLIAGEFEVVIGIHTDARWTLKDYSVIQIQQETLPQTQSEVRGRIISPTFHTE